MIHALLHYKLISRLIIGSSLNMFVILVDMHLHRSVGLSTLEHEQLFFRVV
jgi:predicted neutral ceramidase superfamily lipid hydrolase